MDIVGVDERDSSWEDHDPRFRLYLFQGGDRPQSSWSTDTYDVTGADALEVIDWARNQAATACSRWPLSATTSIA